MNERLLFSSYYLSRSCRSIAVCILIAGAVSSGVGAYASDLFESNDVYLLDLYARAGAFSPAHDRASAIASRNDQQELAEALRAFRWLRAGLQTHEYESLLRVLVESAERSILINDAIPEELAASLGPFLENISSYPTGLRETLLQTGLLYRNDKRWRHSLQVEGHRIERDLEERSGEVTAGEAAAIVAWLEAARALAEATLLRTTVVIEQSVRNRSVVLAARRARTEIEGSIDASTTAD